MATDVHVGPLREQRRKPRVGLIVPPANTAVEDDYLTLGGDVFAFSTARYGVYHDVGLRQRLDRYAAELPSRLMSFGSMPLHAIMACCSGNHYLQGFDADLRDCRTASECTGVITVSTTVAVVAWLRHRGINTITIASPHPDWLTDLSEKYWTSAGFEIDSVIRVVDKTTGMTAGSPYQLGTDDIVTAVRDAELLGTPILLVGTGVHTQAAVTTLTQQFTGQEFYTSNSCGAAWLRLTLDNPNPLARL
ncbi:hypothetical protein MHAE_13870 [Mycobacterium haemophilum DSM 44634]|uniref:hypothetical protein n=1 Tax=Mycobacterium haemophilum TaxID=29311 RepID=UPI000655D7D7|nr:hypothetical protein [Mycobacterium haemophilum]AKN18099.1 hypothetical protein B586_18405 [Mycobacterium haemophilum DSM 44634]MCV7340917.1 hypothetical protein [Mycobacterium haemophilum DSM 44634]